jgi:hypothetical protein
MTQYTQNMMEDHERQKFDPSTCSSKGSSRWGLKIDRVSTGEDRRQWVWEFVPNSDLSDDDLLPCSSSVHLGDAGLAEIKIIQIQTSCLRREEKRRKENVMLKLKV